MGPVFSCPISFPTLGAVLSSAVARDLPFWRAGRCDNDRTVASKARARAAGLASVRQWGTDDVSTSQWQSRRRAEQVAIRQVQPAVGQRSGTAVCLAKGTDAALESQAQRPELGRRRHSVAAIEPADRNGVLQVTGAAPCRRPGVNSQSNLHCVRSALWTMTVRPTTFAAGITFAVGPCLVAANNYGSNSAFRMGRNLTRSGGIDMNKTCLFVALVVTTTLGSGHALAAPFPADATDSRGAVFGVPDMIATMPFLLGEVDLSTLGVADSELAGVGLAGATNNSPGDGPEHVHRR